MMMSKSVLEMTEGRLCQVLLLDDRQLELLVQPKLLSRDLLDLVSSHFNLKEKEYFGISFIDEKGQTNWLQLDRRVLDHDFSKKSGPLELKFQVRFYIESVAYLKDATTVELFFRNAKISVYNENIEVESEIVFKLAAYTVQVNLKKLPALPTAVLKEHPSLAFWVKCSSSLMVLSFLTFCAILLFNRYLTLVESLPAYGVHYYKVKDKQSIPWWLGISYKGIGQYDLQDKLKPRKLFLWKQLENLYFREKKFAVEVNDPQRTTSRRTFGQSGQVIYAWYASHSLIKTIWVMAISQHQFYLDRKQSKAKITTARSLGDIAMDLTETGAPRNSKLVSMESKDKLIMASNGSLVSSNSGDNEVNEEQKKQKIAELKSKQENIKEILALKEEELKKMCLREAELTGVLPKEYPLAPGEKPPNVRRRVGTAFKLDDLFPYDADPHLRNLESCFALQKKIVEAAKKLAYENELCKTVKKKRRRNLLDATKKLQEIENQINDYRVKIGKEPTQRASVIIAASRDLRTRHSSLPLLPLLSSQSPLISPNTPSVKNSAPGISMSLLDCKNSRYWTWKVLDMSLNLKLIKNMILKMFSQIILLLPACSTHFRQRSGSLESQSQFLTESEPSEPVFTISPPRRSNSTEILDDGSSYTSQSSVEYSVPGCHSRAKNRHRRRQGNIYANTGSMPNLAQNETRGYTPQPPQQPTTTAYYVTGYPRYIEPEVYPNGPYMYETEMEGHYNVNPSYYRHDPHGNYGQDEIDGLAHNLYATLRPSRNRPPSRNENIVKNMQRAEVVEHLRGWYNRQHRQQGYDTYRGPQQNLGYRTMSSSYVRSDSTTSYSTGEKCCIKMLPCISSCSSDVNQ
uniref:FERM domain containing 4Ba n=1 Tax=Cyprinus carpio TaxID=7962 RepID=A0A8C1W9X2_CYPCA